MKSFIILVAVLAVSQATPQWESFKMEHNKVYSSPVEETTRFTIFQQNLKEIEEHNKKFDAGEVSWKQGITPFTDWTKEEFLSYLNLSGPLKMPEDAVPFVADAPAADKINWKDQGKVSPVKNQGGCGSCWAFSTTGAIESQLLMDNKTESLSEQQLVDCTESIGNYGCDGGWTDRSFNYIKDNGIERDSDYPYTAKDGSCQYKADKIATKLSGYSSGANENDLKNLVSSKGPTSIYIDASHFQNYKSGVFDTNVCSQKINHAVLAVGYDNEGGKDYWLVKNSWGAGWGEEGYVKMARGKSLCAIGTYDYVPYL